MEKIKKYSILLIFFSLVFLIACNHNMIYVEGVLPTCTLDGYSSHYVCKICGEKEGYEVLSALGHSMVYVEEKEATSFEVGYSSHKSCERCDYTEGKIYYPCKLSLEERPYIRDLDETNLMLIKELYNGAISFEKKIVLENTVTIDELKNAMVLINYYCPELIQINGEYKYSYSSDLVTSVTLTYIMSEEEYLKSWLEIEEVISEVCNNVGSKSAFEKEFYIYNWIIDKCSYSKNTKHSGSVYGALVEGKARCEGYSKGLMMLMWSLGIECYCVTGEALERHAWNVVNIDNKYYFLDPTWDDLGELETSYGFFNVSLEEMISANHFIDEYFEELANKCINIDLSISYLNDTYISSNKDALIEINNIFDRCFQREDKKIYIKVSDIKQFNVLKENAEDILKEYLKNEGISITYHTIYDQNSKTVVFEFVIN